MIFMKVMMLKLR